ncbi:MAG: hypothetical protein DRQ88_09295 [Epsilonproteobacteria bacterium]|nr:MAG: hypothetical protein DRQ88_09295 [Campylobacterota bacterium]
MLNFSKEKRKMKMEKMDQDIILGWTLEKQIRSDDLDSQIKELKEKQTLLDAEKFDSDLNRINLEKVSLIKNQADLFVKVKEAEKFFKNGKEKLEVISAQVEALNFSTVDLFRVSNEKGLDVNRRALNKLNLDLEKSEKLRKEKVLH